MTSILPIPVARYLVPEAPDALPPGFTRVRQALQASVPVTFRLDAELSLVLFAPTGDAVLWRDADGDELVAAADDERAPRGAETEDPTARAPVRFVLRRAGANIATVPLRAALSVRLPDSNVDGGPQIELRVLDFAIQAGTLRETGDFGSFVDFAWRRVDRGATQFALPPLDPRVAERFAGQIQSEVGGDT